MKPLAPGSGFDRTYATVELSEDEPVQDLLAWLDSVGFECSDACEDALTYCTSELVTNALDHAVASSLALRLTLLGELVQVEVEDDGVGLFESIRARLGLPAPLQALDVLAGTSAGEWSVDLDLETDGNAAAELDLEDDDEPDVVTHDEPEAVVDADFEHEHIDAPEIDTPEIDSQEIGCGLRFAASIVDRIQVLANGLSWSIDHRGGTDEPPAGPRDDDTRPSEARSADSVRGTRILVELSRSLAISPIQLAGGPASHESSRKEERGPE